MFFLCIEICPFDFGICMCKDEPYMLLIARSKFE